MTRSGRPTTAQPRRAPTLRAVATVAILALVAAGCGGDDSESFSEPVTEFLATTTSTSPASQLADEIVAALAAQARVVRPEAQLRCVADAAIAAVGVEELIAAGAPAAGTFDGTLLDEEAQSLLIDEVLACSDPEALLSDLGIPISQESIACLTDEVERSGLAEDVIRAAVGTSPDQALADHMVQIVETLNACLTLQEIARVLETFGLVPFLPGG